jgi:hypothetical protein
MNGVAAAIAEGAEGRGHLAPKTPVGIRAEAPAVRPSGESAHPATSPTALLRILRVDGLS